MSKIPKFLVVTLLAGSICQFSLQSASAAKKKNRQEVGVEQIKVEQNVKGETQSIVKGSNSGSSLIKGKWTRIKSTFYNQGDWIDELDLRVSVLLYNKKTKNKKKQKTYKDPFTLLTGSDTYVNIPVDKKNEISVFIHPHTIERYGEVVEVKVDLYVDGVLKDSKQQRTSKSKKEKKRRLKDNWWTGYKPLSGLILNYFYTPFAYDGDVSSAALKVKAS